VKTVKVRNIEMGDGKPLVLIAGPCVIEEESVVYRIAEKIKKISENVSIPFIFKSSYLKDNRSSADSYQGIGVDKGLEILNNVKNKFEVPVLSDVHSVNDVEKASQVLDVIQIPAFLSMQTSLTLAVGKTGKPVNVKKGQFLHPYDMKNIIGKLESVNNYNILLTERGSCFGYRTLVTDFRSLQIMRSLGYPVVFDPTHSLRNYGIPSGERGGGSPEFVPSLSRAGVATGIDAIFIETHDDLNYAKCDASSMLPLEKLEDLLKILIEIDALVKTKIKLQI
jgi:2-dehydro-3-deoxyphosphooctonate aldolase (KDO 8-P synthase)